jgi:hypothetical protein
MCRHSFTRCPPCLANSGRLDCGIRHSRSRSRAAGLRSDGFRSISDAIPVDPTGSGQASSATCRPHAAKRRHGRFSGQDSGQAPAGRCSAQDEELETRCGCIVITEWTETVETVFSRLDRSFHLTLTQLNLFRSIRSHVHRKRAAHTLAFSTGQLGFKLRQEQEKGISVVRNTSQRAFLPTESPGQDIPSHSSRR